MWVSKKGGSGIMIDLLKLFDLVKPYHLSIRNNFNIHHETVEFIITHEHYHAMVEVYIEELCQKDFEVFISNVLRQKLEDYISFKSKYEKEWREYHELSRIVR